MTSIVDADLTAPEPWQRLEATRRYAPAGAQATIAALKQDVVRWAHTFSENQVADPISGLPDWLQPAVKDWGLHLSLYGAANAWLIFVGPSPGGSPTSDPDVDRLLGSSHRRNPTLGWPHPSFWYPDRPGFGATIRRWATSAMTGVAPQATEGESLTCTLMVNLTQDQFANASDVNLDNSSTAAAYFWASVVPVARPRLVIALTRPIYRQLSAALHAEQIRNLPSVDVVMAKRWVQLQSSVTVLGTRCPLLLTTVPMHPSRRSFLGSDLGPLYRYLGETARKARDLT